MTPADKSALAELLDDFLRNGATAREVAEHLRECAEVLYPEEER